MQRILQYRNEAPDTVLGLPVTRALAITGAVAVLALLAVAGPALSTRPWIPKAVDFEMAAPGPNGRGASASRGGFVSEVARPGKRFNLVGFRWPGRAEPDIAVRARKDGGEWTRWAPVQAHTEDAPDPGPEGSSDGLSAPVWVGQADELQYRMSRRPPGLRLHFVNSTGTATAADRARTAVRKFVNRGVVAGARVATAHAQGAAPPIVPRAQWGADQCTPRGRPSYGAVQAAFVHHTVTANDYTPAESPSIVLGICRYHRNSNGWTDVGYNFLVDKYGTLFEGRAGGIDRAVVGAQAQGYNSETTGIANMGTHESVPQTDAALSAMARLIRWKLPIHGAPTAGTVQVTSAGGSANRYPAGSKVTLNRVAGHRDGNSTSCPGAALYAQLPDLRNRVGNLSPQAPVRAARTKVEISRLRPGVVRFPGPARVRGRVLALAGNVAISGREVVVQQRLKTEWRPIGRGTTQGDGRFEVPATPKGSGFLRVSFPGDGTFLSSISKPARVKLRPLIEARRSVIRARVGQTPSISGRVQPRKKVLQLVVQRRLGRRNARVARVRMVTKAGRFRKGFRVARPGLWRFYVRFAGDRDTLSSTSTPFYVRVAGASRGGGAR